MENSKYSSFQFERTFDVTNKQLVIWKSYHNENQIKNYNLFENERIFLFNTTNLGYAGKNINHLNRLFCEGVCILYPYFNNLKSDIIGFQHYRRWYNSSIEDLKINEINNGKIQVFQDREPYIKYENVQYNDIYTHFCFWRQLDCGFYNDCIEYLKNNFPEYLVEYSKRPLFHGFSLFVCNWNKYVKFCNLLWEYLLFIANKYHFNVYSENDWVEFIKEHYLKFNREHHISCMVVPWNCKESYREWYHDDYINDPESFKYYRIFSFNVEFFVSMFANIEGYIFDKNNVVHFENGKF